MYSNSSVHVSSLEKKKCKYGIWLKDRFMQTTCVITHATHEQLHAVMTVRLHSARIALKQLKQPQCSQDIYLLTRAVFRKFIKGG